jgi:hypothetical protein
MTLSAFRGDFINKVDGDCFIFILCIV